MNRPRRDRPRDAPDGKWLLRTSDLTLTADNLAAAKNTSHLGLLGPATFDDCPEFQGSVASETARSTTLQAVS